MNATSFSAVDRSSIERLGDALRGGSFSNATIAKMLGTQRTELWLDRKLPMFLRRMSEESPIETWMRLFVLGVPVGEAQCREALPRDVIEGMWRIGVLRAGSEPDSIESSIAISPHEGLIIAHDPWSPAVAPDPEAVPGLAPSPLWLDRFTVRRPVDSALDIGTGSGIQALLAAQHSERVTATDVSGRATTFCTFNASLNGFSNIDVLQGDLFEPVEAERFDLIVCNPPYVMSPEKTHLYSDAGSGDDNFCRRLLQGVPTHLAEGGYACVVANWGIGSGEGWADPALGWVEGSDCDALVLLDHRSKPLVYASSMNRDLVGDDIEYGRALDRWVAYYEASGIQEIVGGAIILRRRRDTANWADAVEASSTRENVGEQLVYMFEGRSLIDGLDEEQLLELRPSMVDGVTFVERNVVRGGSPVVLHRSVQASGGLRFVQLLQGSEWEVFRRADGSRTLRGILDDLGIHDREVRLRALATLGALVRAGQVKLEA